MNKKHIKLHRMVLILLLCAIIATVAIITLPIISRNRLIASLRDTVVPEYVTVDLIPKDLFHSRNGLTLIDVKNIVIHYVGNPGTSAQNNRDYFATAGTNVNSHFVIGLEGEIIQCIPLHERSSASNWRNKDTISIEVCHPDEAGEFTQEAVESLVKLTAWLCNICNLDKDDIIRHYDITGKKCPLYYVDNNDAWEALLKKIEDRL